LFIYILYVSVNSPKIKASRAENWAKKTKTGELQKQVGRKGVIGACVGKTKEPGSEAISHRLERVKIEIISEKVTAFPTNWVRRK